MGTAPQWRAASAFAAVLLAAAGVAGLASAYPAVGQVSGSAAAAVVTPGGPAPPVPTVDGVQRFNVGATHSPALLRQLSGPLSRTRPEATPTSLRGIDVAAHQHPDGAAINWTRVAPAGYRFAFIKATEGNYYGNPYYASDFAQARAAGLYAAGYHFAVPNVSGGVNQADYAVSHASQAASQQTLPVALDIEYDPYASSDHTNKCYGLSPAQMVAWIGAFDGEVQRLTGRLPIIYTSADWWNSCTGGSTAFGAALLWVAAYGVSSPSLPRGWSNWAFWQYTAVASVPGISGNVDGDYASSTLAGLAAPSGAITGYAGKCVDDWRSGTANGNKIGLYSCNGTAAQHWVLTASGQLQVFGKCLDDTAGGGQGTTVELYTCTGGANQRWTHLANGEYVLASNGLCLNDPGYATANGTPLIIWACVNTSNEHWSGPT